MYILFVNALVSFLMTMIVSNAFMLCFFVCRVYHKVSDDGGKQCELFVSCVELLFLYVTLTNYTNVTAVVCFSCF